MKISELRYLYYVSDAYPTWEENDERVIVVINELRVLASLTEGTAIKHIMEFLKGDINFGQAVKGRYNWCVRAVELHPQVAIYKTQNGPVFVVFGTIESIHSFKIGVAPIESLYCTSDLRKQIPMTTRRLINKWLVKCELNEDINIGYILAEYTKRFSR